MGVPQLMMILEPNIVWDHAHAFSAPLKAEVEAHYCPGACAGGPSFPEPGAAASRRAARQLNPDQRWHALLS